MNTMDINLRKITHDLFKDYGPDFLPHHAAAREPNPFTTVMAVIGMTLLASLVIAALVSLNVDMSSGDLTGTAQDTGWGYGL